MKTFKYRIYPTDSQKMLINKHLGCVRWVWNYALEKKISAYREYGVSLSSYDILNDLPRLKQDFEWLGEVNSQSLQNIIISDLEKAMTRFYKDKIGFPKFKSKHKPVQSFCVPQKFKLKKNKLHIPKFKSGLKLALSRPIEGVVKSIRVMKTNTDKYFACLACEIGDTPIQKPIHKETTIGIDMGLSHFLTTSNGLKVDNPRIYRNNEKRLKVLARRLSRKQKGSKNREKAKLKVALLHEKMTNTRNDFLHKLTSQIVNENQVDTFVIEDLSIKEMIQNGHLAKSIYDASWAKFFTLLEYKTKWAGKNLVRIGRFEPSSKLCSKCGYVHRQLKLSDRFWACPSCDTRHDRDINAALNIKSMGLDKRNSGQGLPGEPVELPALVGALRQEVFTEICV